MFVYPPEGSYQEQRWYALLHSPLHSCTSHNDMRKTNQGQMYKLSPTNHKLPIYQSRFLLSVSSLTLSLSLSLSLSFFSKLLVRLLISLSLSLSPSLPLSLSLSLSLSTCIYLSIPLFSLSLSLSLFLSLSFSSILSLVLHTRTLSHEIQLDDIDV